MHALRKRVDEITTQQRILENIIYNGKLLWKIDDISIRITEAEKGTTTSLCSAPAYTGHYGYKLCDRIYLNGDGIERDNHISVFFILLNSECGMAILKEVTCSLLNPENMDKSKCISFMPNKDPLLLETKDQHE